MKMSLKTMLFLHLISIAFYFIFGTYFLNVHSDNEELMMNPNCRQITFMNYLREKCQYYKEAVIDLIDEDGNLSMVHSLGNDENVRANFIDRMNYVPCLIEKNPDDTTLKKVKPLLNDWEKRFPQLEKKIKILTGELKKGGHPGRKSPTRASVSKGGSRMDRSVSNIQRAAMSQAGKSSAKLSSANIAERGKVKPDKPEKRAPKTLKGRKK